MIVQDRVGTPLEVGDNVLWFDPDLTAWELNKDRVYNVDEVVNEEMVRISDEFSEAEVLPHELVALKKC